LYHEIALQFNIDNSCIVHRSTMPNRGSSLPSIESDEFVPESVPPDEPASSSVRLHDSFRAIHQEVWELAWPSVLTMLLQTVNSLMDMFFVGHLPNGRQALAATGTGGSIVFLLVSVAMGVTVGTTALVARFTGAGDDENVLEATGQSVALGAILGVGLGILAFVARAPIVNAVLDVVQNPGAASMCITYLQIALIAMPALFVMNVFHSAYRGSGDTRTPLLVTLATIGTHITFNYLLIYGHLGFPRMGVAGAATAFAISLFMGVGIFLALLPFRPALRGCLRPAYLRPRTHWAWRILRIGAPAAVQAVIRTLAMMSFSGMLARTLERDASVAALQIGVRSESIAFMPGFGYSVAASALVGQNLGAKDPSRAERCALAATLQGIGIMALMAALFYACARQFASAFTSDPTVCRLGADYLRVNAICEPFLGLGMVLTGALQGAGDTLRPTYITMVNMWLVRLPLAYTLMFSLNMQTHGAWLSMAVTTIIGGLWTLALFRTGKWKRVKV
jgi:putative MATE family efflux protein